MKIEMSAMLLALSLLLLALGLSALLYSRYYVKKICVTIDRILDGVLAKSPVPVFEITRDNMLSKLAHKGVNAAVLTNSELHQLSGEKKILQSFISDMSHQMKTPLASVTMYTEMLLAGDLKAEEQQEFLRRIQRDNEKLCWMIENLIKVSRLETGAIELSPCRAPIRETIAKSISGVLTQASQRKITITCKEFTDRMLYHDPKWTREAISNVLENAVKYSFSESEITISLEALPIYSKIIISNRGIGVDPSEWNDIFKRFYRGKNASEYDGSGLGLHLSSLIMAKQGGYIMVSSVPGGQTTFSLFLQNCKD